MTSSTEGPICPECGQAIKFVKVCIGGQDIMRVPATCACRIAQREKEEEAKRKAEQQARLNRMFALADLGPRFQECTFENWEDRSGSEHTFRAVKKYAEEFKQNAGDGLLIFGAPGNGKSHLAAAAVNYLIPRGVTCVFRSSPGLLKRLQDTYGPDSRYTETEILKELERADLLVLDDIGAEQSERSHRHSMTAWAESVLYNIIDSRYRWKKPIIVTTNCGIEELESRISERTFDRILEMCLLVENGASSYRKERAMKRIKEVVS